MKEILIRGRRLLVGAVLAAIAVSAALGISALASAHFGSLQWKVLGTSGCATGAGLLVLACLPALDRGLLRQLPALGIAAALAGFTLLVIGMWSETGADPLWKTAGSLLVLAVLAASSSLLALASLAPRFRRALPVALVLALVVGVLAVYAIWDGTSNGAFWRVFGVFAVLLGAVTLAIPVLQRASRAGPAAAALRFCPSCGRRLEGGTGSCRTCGARFEVRFS